ncbi:MAG TPA: hypothetical protein VF657_07955 [Actinoplanes sp.]|jgi:sulfonate transport system substrate-binding protein
MPDRTVPLIQTDVAQPSRRMFLTGVVGAAGAAALGLTGCSADPAGVELAAAAPLPTVANPDTELVIAIHPTHVALRASGQLGKLPFRVRDWPNLTA